ncbi:Rieske (2Fe-2S) protein [Microtetraspora fusca]|uniref:Rieske (2Fe-2S) protein n=1 Tax=Microtetraspora fusca TaxID=1997 RepID=A0ABW6VBH0_MICFU
MGVIGTPSPATRTSLQGANWPGGLRSVVPEGYEHDPTAQAKATLILTNLRPEELRSQTDKHWMDNGIVAHSKICTHVGRPAAPFLRTTHHILCPRHRSTFDATDGAQVVFGPTARSLPQLPLDVDIEGHLVARGDLAIPVGAGFRERGDTEAEAEVRNQGRAS